MGQTHTSTFTITGNEPAEPYATDDGVISAHMILHKRFSGQIDGVSRVDMISTRTPEGGAGYVATERFSGKVGARTGGFVLLHMGTMSGAEKSASWPIVPGSGTGELTGIAGRGVIDIDGDGLHHFRLELD